MMTTKIKSLVRHLTQAACLVAFLMPCLALSAQTANKHLRKVVRSAYLTETFHVLASDTTVRDGLYTMTYRGRKIEQGKYSNGRKVGPWSYWNYNKMVEMVYNYSLGQPTQILPHIGKKYSQDNYPCIYLGSPVIPHMFIMKNIYYPLAEKDNKDGGKVVLTIMVDERGAMYDYSIKESTSENFSIVIRKVAEMIPEQNWRWVPAHKDGKPTKGEYDITVFFDN